MPKQIQRIGKIALFISLIFCWLQNQDVEQMQKILDALPNHGYGLLARIKNNSEESANIEFDKTTHDALPDTTIVRIKSFDPELGPEGKYFVVSKDADKRFIMAPTTTNPTEASTFIIYRRLSKDLQDWLGISATNANNAFMRFDTKSTDVVFDKTEKDFREDENTDCHWKIPDGMTIDAAILTNRSTQGALYNFKGERPVVVKEEKIMSNDVWGIKSEYIEIPIIEKIDKDPYKTEGLTGEAKFKRPVKFGDKVVIAFNEPYPVVIDGIIAKNPQIACTSLSKKQIPFDNVIITNEQGMDPDDELRFGQINKFAIRFSLGNPAGQYLHAFPKDIGPKPALEDDDEKFFITKEDTLAPTTEPVQYGQSILIKSCNGDYLRRQKGSASTWQGEAYKFMLLSRGNKGEFLAGKFKGYEQVKTKSTLFSSIHTMPQMVSSTISQIAVIDATHAWGLDVNGNLYKWSHPEKQDKPTWKQFELGQFAWVAASPEGIVFLISKDNTKTYQLTKQETIQEITSPYEGLLQIAAASEINIWGIDKNKSIQQYTATGWVKIPTLDKSAVSITVLDNGNIRALGSAGDIWEYNSDKKQWLGVVAPANTKIIKLSGNYAISDAKTGNVYNWNSNTWTEPLFSNTHYDDIAVANGYQIKQTIEQRQINCASIITPPNEKTKLAFEIVKIGMGGGIAGNGFAIDFEAMPVSKKPTIKGIAKNIKPPLVPGVPFTIPIMKAQGGAWFDGAFPGNASFGIVAMPGDKGGLHIKLGDKIGDNFLYDIVIGGAQNTKASIIKRTFIGKTPQDTAVFECFDTQSKFAKMLAGEPNPYWISHNNGLICAGMGNIGENPFMAWRDPKPTAQPTRLAIASEDQAFACVYPRLDDPIITNNPTRIYRSFVTKPEGPIAFRFPNHGSLNFNATGKKAITITLLSKNEQDEEEYYITIQNTDPAGIVITKKALINGNYETISCADLLAEQYPAIALTEKSKPFWVSYDDGQILMGQGSIGENILLMYQDITPPAVIDAINLTVDEATVQNLAIAPPVSLGQASNVESYDKPKINIKDFSTSSMTLLLPFEYQFNQEEEAVTIYDGILNKGPDRIAGTLEKGTFYKFNFQINPDGGYEMEWLNQPDNPTQQKVQKALLIADAEQARLQSKIDLMAKEGAIAKQEKEAEAQRKTNTGEQIASGARLVAETLGGIPGIGTMAATAATFGAQAATQIYGAMAADINLDAAKIELQAQKRGLEVEAKAKELEYQAKLLQGAAAVAFTGNDGYFLKDKLTPTQIQEGQISQDIIDLEPQIAAKLDQIEQQVSPENLIWRITQAQNMVYLIKHFYPIRKEEMRDRIWSDLTALYKEGSTAADAQQELQDLLFLAYNNSFLTGMDADAPTLRKTWINNIRKVATKALTNPNEDFMLCNCFGEYVALGKLPKEGAGLITFEAMGENDLLIGFTKSKDKPIRNSAEELYEVGIGCWQNTKHVIRAENLGKSIVEVSTDDAPDSQLPAQEFQKYWVNINQGHVAAGIGDPGTNTFISWQDPYPTPKLNYIMASAWNAPITIKNIKIAAALNLTGIPETSGAKVLTDPATIGGVNPQTTDAMELAKIEDESNAEIQSIATPTVPEPTAPVEEEIAQEKPVSEDEVMAEV